MVLAGAACLAEAVKLNTVVRHRFSLASFPGLILLVYTLLKMGSYSSTMMCHYWDNHLIY